MSILAYKRLTSEYRKLLKEPVDLIQAKPQDDNILIWHFILEGPPNTPYSGGQYYGVMTLPLTYPMDAPSVKVITPNGRFTSGGELCITMTNYENTGWNPMWSVSSILVGLVSFMLEESSGVGSISGSLPEREKYAQESREFNNQCYQFQQNFPEVVELNKLKLKKSRTKKEVLVPSATATATTATDQVTTPATTATTAKKTVKQSKRQRLKSLFFKLKKAGDSM